MFCPTHLLLLACLCASSILFRGTDARLTRFPYYHEIPEEEEEEIFLGEREIATNGGFVSSTTTSSSSSIREEVGVDNFEEQCHEFCTSYFHLIPTTTLFEGGFGGCMESCNGWPRTKAPTWNHARFLGGDTFECRRFHLFESDVDSIPFHSFHSLNDGAAICDDILIDGMTPHRHKWSGRATYHHFAYCDLFKDDTVADCSWEKIDDEDLPYALQMLPATVEYIFLDKNPITRINDDTFTHLKSPATVKALYLDDCEITTLTANAFAPLVNLQLLNLPFNYISTLPDGLLDNLPMLRSFNVNGDPTPGFGDGKVGLLSCHSAACSYSQDLFQNNPHMERIQMYGHRGIQILPPGLFRGLGNLQLLFILFLGLTNEGTPPEAFQDLVSMVYFDLQGNNFTHFDPNWFRGGQQQPWVSNIERLVFFACGITEPITDVDIFRNMPKLKWLYLHNNPGIRTLPEGIFDHNPEISTVTLGFPKGK